MTTVCTASQPPRPLPSPCTVPAAKCVACDAHLVIAPQVAVRRRAATGHTVCGAVVGTLARLFRYVNTVKLQPARVFYRNALHCLAAVRVRYRYGVAARAQPRW